MRIIAVCLVLGVVSLLCGCGTKNNPCVYENSFDIGSNSPSNTANHASTPPLNQVKFSATTSPFAVSGTGCVVPTTIAIVDALWASSDTKDVTISSAPDATNGLATCVNATAGPVTITATAPTGTSLDYTPKTATITLTCK